jgi:ParB family chromosome partitioning protein
MLSIRDKLEGQNTKLAEQKDPIQNYLIASENDQEGSFFNIELSAIAVDPGQPRKYFDPASLAELCESIKQKGVLQPVLIRKDREGQIRLVVGERRYRAAQMAGMEGIPAILTKGNPHEIALRS